MNATIKDVAKLAGVSFRTVPRISNREPSVGEEQLVENIRSIGLGEEIKSQQHAFKPELVVRRSKCPAKI
ncbi:MAG: LacI family DNA-binding transcriptional regulator [Halioglobus sp.]